MCKVAAVVVTYNRKELLLECVDAIIKQTYAVNKLIIIDNASTDNTYEALEEKGFLNVPCVDYVRMERNSGGAGGFYEGLRLIEESDCDWAWIMDDDTIPTSTCLEELIKADEVVKKADLDNAHAQYIVRKPAFYASAVYGTNGEFMNVPTPGDRKSVNGYRYCYRLLEHGIAGIKKATFVSLLIPKEAIAECGLPCADFFIWGDDSEYTTRLLKHYGEGYLVGKSVAIHKRADASSINIKNETNENRIKNYYYLYRNTDIYKKYHYGHYASTIPKVVIKNFSLIFSQGGMRKYFTILKGTIAGRMQYKKFKKYIDEQLGKKRDFN